MASKQEFTSTEILKEFSILEKNVSEVAYLNYTMAGQLLDKNPSVIAQYVKSGLIPYVQQGNEKLILMSDVYLLKACIHAAKHYGCSYTACKMFAELLKNSNVDPCNYMSYIRELEEKAKLSINEVAKHVNSYKNRGIFQKKKAEESRKDFLSSIADSARNRFK